MRADVVRLLECAGRIDAIDRLDELCETVGSILRPFGATTLSVNLIEAPGRVFSPRGLAGGVWLEWSDLYVRSGFAEHDPAIRMLKAASRPFAWSDALRRFPGRAGQRVMDACREVTGGGQGFVVPVRDSDGALLTAAFSGPDLDLSPETRPALHLAGYYFAMRGRELAEGVALAPDCPLTPRQIECLRWVHAGKTDEEIAVLLDISPRTAHHHVEAAKAAMNTPKRAVAAFEAWRRGWLE
jgi:LuxR family transcriptional regulator, quorum-sensing system regulator BjaR1